MTYALPIEFPVLRQYPGGTNLLRQGTTATEMYLVKTGCVRSWFNKDGTAITLQFFFEGETVTALESFLHDTPSEIFLEAIEDTEVGVISRESFLDKLHSDPDTRDWFHQEAIRKLLVHTRRLLSLLQLKPYERYQQLLAGDSRILQRIPQQYIASYLGITPVSLSRIRHRKK